MIRPVLMHDDLLRDIDDAREDRQSVHFWWLGQSGFLVQWHGHHLLLDPYLSDSLTHKYAQTDKPHVRMTELVVDPARLDFVDLVTSSHNHTDHLDAETLRPLLEVNPGLHVLVPAANRQFAAERLQIESARLSTIDAGATRQFGPFTVRAVPAAHESIERDEAGRCRFLGYCVEVGPLIIYHSGDTVLYEGMVEQLRKSRIDVAILPINGRGPERRVAGNLWGREAAQLAHDIGAGTVIPCHYEMFEFNTASPDEFVTLCQQLKQPHVVLACGQRWSMRA